MTNPSIGRSGRARPTTAIVAALVGMLLVAACAPRPLVLPAGTGTPSADFLAPFEQASSNCSGVRTITAEIRMSGKVGTKRLRGTLLAGLAAPDALRLEAVAPFGPPVFILVADRGSATLLLPRDDRVLTGVSPADILDALAGVRLDPATLRGILTGCVVASPQPSRGRTYTDGWLAVDLGAATAFLRQEQRQWRIVAGQVSDLTVEYLQFENGRPRTVAVRSAAGSTGGAAVNLTLVLAQVTTNTTLAPAAFQLDVPTSAAPLSLEELRNAGPLGEKPRQGLNDR